MLNEGLDVLLKSQEQRLGLASWRKVGNRRHEGQVEELRKGGQTKWGRAQNLRLHYYLQEGWKIRKELQNASATTITTDDKSGRECWIMLGKATKVFINVSRSYSTSHRIVRKLWQNAEAKNQIIPKNSTISFDINVTRPYQLEESWRGVSKCLPNTAIIAYAHICFESLENVAWSTSAFF